MRSFWSFCTTAFVAAIQGYVGPAQAGLIEPEDIAKEVNNGAIIIDIREGGDELELTIVPNSIHLPFSMWRGPAENPGERMSRNKAAVLFGDAGLSQSTKLIIANDGLSNSSFGASARAVWDLKSFGFSEVKILHGGINAYASEGMPFVDSRIDLAKQSLELDFSGNFYASSDEIKEVIESEATRSILLDARPQEWHQGKLWHPASKLPGTIPRSTVLDYSSFFVSDLSSRLVDRQELDSLIEKLPAHESSISFCEVGWWSAGNWFILSQMMDMPRARLYADGRVDWSLKSLPQKNAPTEKEFEQMKREQSL